ncbi:MAG: LytTR family DNA-binding domain-containing protein [Actinomycetota bacterium]|nr:LytTR family DNA-binding domain-containing protein [Actinomycetota bacterium]
MTVPDVDASPSGLRVLVVDDEQPVCDELAFLLARDPRVSRVDTASSGAAALRLLEGGHIDALFLDIAMPDLTGLDVARVLARFRAPPAVVFVTAHEDFAVDAFELDAVDYVLKPVAADRLAEAVRRVAAQHEVGAAGAVHADKGHADDVLPVERGGVTRFVARSEVVWVEANGDYTRLHTASDSHLVRVPLSALERRWAGSGFVRIHRSLLVDTNRVLEVRTDSGRTAVLLPGPGGPVSLQVARRHVRELRDLLVRGRMS